MVGRIQQLMEAAVTPRAAEQAGAVGGGAQADGGTGAPGKLEAEAEAAEEAAQADEHAGSALVS